jgi:predicted nucleic acid-binding Zn finger protein
MTNVFIPKEEATCNQTVEQYNTKLITTKDRREGKGRVLAISRRMYRLRQNTDTFYVESESSDDQYYIAKFKPDILESSWYCSCKDNSTRSVKCKHLFAIEFAIKWGIIKDIDKIPNTNIDQSTSNNIQAAIAAATETKSEVVVASRTPKSYLEDDYDF